MARGRVKRARVAHFLRRHWRALTFAFVAVLGETLADVVEPWPIKVVVDSVLQSKKLPGWLDDVATSVFGFHPIAILDFAVAAVAGIAVLGAVSSYFEKYFTTSIASPNGSHTICGERSTTTSSDCRSPNTTRSGPAISSHG